MDEEKMKIAFIYDAVYPWVKGGAEKRVYEIARRLAIRGHQVHWYSIGWWWENGQNRDIELDGIQMHGVCPPQELYVNGKRSIKEAVFFGWKLLNPLMKENFDVIDCQEFPYFSCFTTKLHSVMGKSRMVITWYEVWDQYWFEYIGRMGYFGRLIERITAKLPQLVLPISSQIKKDLKMLNVDPNITRVIPNGVDFQQLQKAKAGPVKLDIIYVGRLISHKNVDVLLEAVSIMKKEKSDIKCGVVGSGPEMEHLKQMSAEMRLEDNVKFFGFVEKDEDVYGHFKSAELFILPSTREGFPNTILEANACGLPAIIVRHEKNAGVGVVKDGKNGYILELSPEEIGKKALNLLNNKTELQKLQESSVEFAKEYDWEIIVDKIEKVYKEVLQ